MLQELCKGTSILAQTLSLPSSNALPSLPPSPVSHCMAGKQPSGEKSSGDRDRERERKREREGGSTTWIRRMSGATALVLNKGEAVTGHGQAKICIVLVLLLVKWQHG